MTEPPLDVHYVPTPPEAVARMLALAEIRPGELVCDLGCGDGRIVIAAAQKHGARAIGFDLDIQRVREARLNVQRAGLAGRVAIQHADIFTIDLSHADVVTLYLLSSLNRRLLPQLARLKAGARIVSHDFPLPGCKPRKVVYWKRPDGQEQEISLWLAPLQLAGAAGNARAP